MVANVHERRVTGAVEKLSGMISSISGPNDTLWPSDAWPPMRLDQALTVGSTGGHGPIRYTVESYDPGRSVSFRFADGLGLVGTHCLTVEQHSDSTAVVRHEINGRVTGSMRVLWPLAIRWLHDALVEDLLDNAEAAVAGQLTPPVRLHGLGVRVLRQAMTPAQLRGRGRRAAGMATAATLAALAALHGAWAAGSSFPASDRTALANAVVGGTQFPNAVASGTVAALLAVSTALVVARTAPTGAVGQSVPGQLAWVGTAATSAVLALRGVAGLAGSAFNLVNTSPEFRRLDFLVYSPLCIALALGTHAVIRPAKST
jgi:hypothetical protein